MSGGEPGRVASEFLFLILICVLHCFTVKSCVALNNLLSCSKPNISPVKQEANDATQPLLGF